MYNNIIVLIGLFHFSYEVEFVQYPVSTRIQEVLHCMNFDASKVTRDPVCNSEQGNTLMKVFNSKYVMKHKDETQENSTESSDSGSSTDDRGKDEQVNTDVDVQPHRGEKEVHSHVYLDLRRYIDEEHLQTGKGQLDTNIQNLLGKW